MRIITATFIWFMVVVTGISPAGERQLGLTIYHKDFALVKDRRVLDLQAGVNEFRFTDVAATIEPTSVRFRSLDDPKAKIVEQNFEFDLVKAEKLLAKYIDHEVELLTEKGAVVTGTLLRAENDKLIIKTQDALKILPIKTIQAIKLAKLPEGLITKPTLVWQIYTEKKGKQRIQLDYIARKIKWDVNYPAVLSSDETKLDITGWVTLDNQSAVGFPDADVTLIAGESHRTTAREYSYGIDYLRAISTLPPTRKRGKDVSETFGEYRLYRLKEPTTLKSNQIKQIRLISARNVPVKKIYLYDGAKIRFSPYRGYREPAFGREANKKINVLLSLENRADHNLGFALPEGKVRIFKRDRDDSLEFVGEDKLPGTARDERILLYVGDAFDLTGSRTQSDFKRISERVIEEAFKIELKNHKDQPVTITVIEKLYRWRSWEILKSSHKYKKIDARTIKFEVPVKPDQKQIITYRVRYTW